MAATARASDSGSGAMWSRCGRATTGWWPKKRDYRAPAMAAIKKAYEDAGQQMPDDLNPTNLR